MPDKLRKTVPLNVTFGAGEQPTSTKMNVISTQSRNGLAIVEHAIGDVWNQSGDQFTNNLPLQIPNLARLLGQNKFLNPAIFPLQNDFRFRENLGVKSRQKVSGWLTFKPETGLGTITTFDDPVPHFGVLVAEEYLVGDGVPNEYFVSDVDGRWRTDDPLTGVEKIEYRVAPSDDWLDGAEAFPGVIPDPRQAEFVSCRIEDIGGGLFHLHLPPRRPLNFATSSGGPTDARYRPAAYPDDIDIGLAAGNEATSTGGDLKYWQSDTVNALDHAHYRYSLPKDLLDTVTGVGEEFPAGSLYLWDNVSNTVIENIVFRKTSVGSWIIEVENNGAFDMAARAAAVPDDESLAAYDNDLILITCGSPVARSLWLLAAKMLTHSHSNTGALDAMLSHNSLLDTDPPVDHAAHDHFGRYPDYIPRWSPSRWDNDRHTHLLSRMGAQDDPARERDLLNNAMLGHLIMANADTSGAGNFIDGTLPDGSFRIAFGDLSSPYIQGSDANTLVFDRDIDVTQDSYLFNLPAPANPDSFEGSEGSDVPSGTYNFWVIAFDADGNHTEPSVVESRTVGGGNGGIWYDFDDVAAARPGSPFYRVYVEHVGVQKEYFDQDWNNLAYDGGTYGTGTSWTTLPSGTRAKSIFIGDFEGIGNAPHIWTPTLLVTGPTPRLGIASTPFTPLAPLHLKNDAGLPIRIDGGSSSSQDPSIGFSNTYGTDNSMNIGIDQSTDYFCFRYRTGTSAISSLTNSGSSNVMLMDLTTGFIGMGDGIGSTRPVTKIHIRNDDNPGAAIRLDKDDSSGGAATVNSGYVHGVQMVCSGPMNAGQTFMPMLSWIANDPDLGGEKVVGAITCGATETYVNSSDGGSEIRFHTTPNNPGTGNNTEQRWRIRQDGHFDPWPDDAQLDIGDPSYRVRTLYASSATLTTLNGSPNVAGDLTITGGDLFLGDSNQGIKKLSSSTVIFANGADVAQAGADGNFYLYGAGEYMFSADRTRTVELGPAMFTKLKGTANVHHDYSANLLVAYCNSEDYGVAVPLPLPNTGRILTISCDCGRFLSGTFRIGVFRKYLEASSYETVAYSDFTVGGNPHTVTINHDLTADDGYSYWAAGFVTTATGQYNVYGFRMTYYSKETFISRY